MKTILVILMVACGMLVPMQVALNSYLRNFVISPTYAVLISFSVSAVIAAIASLIGTVQGHQGNLLGAFNAPWWAWMGGVLAALYVTLAVFTIPRIGAMSFSVATIVGQLLGALLIDYFGLFSLPKHPITGLRIIGIGLLLMSLWLVRR